MRYGQVSRIGVVLALAATLLHSLPAWAQTPHGGGDTYRNPNPEGGRVKCSDGGPLKEYLDKIPHRQAALKDELKILDQDLVEARGKLKDAQKDLDIAIQRGTRGQQNLAREKLAAAINAVLKIEDDIRTKKSELDRIPQEKANTLADIKQLCDGLPRLPPSTTPCESNEDCKARCPTCACAGVCR